MTCQHCGAALSPEARFCAACGKTVGGAAPQPQVETPPPGPESAPSQPLSQTGTDIQATAHQAQPGTPPVSWEGQADGSPQPQPDQEPGAGFPPLTPEQPAAAPQPPTGQTDGPPPQPYGETFQAGEVPPGAQPYQEPPPKKRGSKKVPLIVGGLLLVALVVAAVVFFGGGSPAAVSGDRYMSELYMFHSWNKTLSIIDRNAVEVFDFGIFDDGDYERSMDGASLLVYEEEGSDSGTLWFVTKTDKIHIAGDVSHYVISDTGAGVAYLTDYDSRGGVGRLYLYDPQTGESAKIAEDVLPASVCLSPDGKIVGYTDEGETAYLYQDGAKEEIGDEAEILAVADRAAYIYYVDAGGFYVRKGEEENRLSSDTSWRLVPMFNTDYSEVVYTHSNRVYISRDAGDRERLSGGDTVFFVRPNTLQFRATYTNSIIYMVYGFDSFVNHVFYDDDHVVWYLEEDLTTTRIGSANEDSINIDITAGGKLYYVDVRDNLMACDLAGGNRDTDLLTRDVEDFSVSLDGKTICVTDLEGAIYLLEGEERRFLADKADEMLAVDSGVFFTAREEGTADSPLGEHGIYYSADGAEVTRLDSASVITIFPMSSGIGYYAMMLDDRDVVFTYYTEGEEPRLLLES